MHSEGDLQELTVAKAELSSAKSDGSKHKNQCSELQSHNATLSSELRHSQQNLTAAQVHHLPGPVSISSCLLIAQQGRHASSGMTGHHQLRNTQQRYCLQAQAKLTQFSVMKSCYCQQVMSHQDGCSRDDSARCVHAGQGARAG